MNLGLEWGQKPDCDRSVATMDNPLVLVPCMALPGGKSSMTGSDGQMTFTESLALAECVSSHNAWKQLAW